MDLYDLLVSKHQIRRTYTPKELLSSAVEYFKWCEKHPLQEERLFHHQGEITRASSEKVRAFTKTGLTLHLGVPLSRLDTYRAKEEYSEVMELIDAVLYEQKFTNAAAGLLKEGIISRDLGLADKQEVQTHEIAPPAPPDERRIANVMHPDATVEEIDRFYEAGKEPPLYTPEQIEAGIPWVMPTDV